MLAACAFSVYAAERQIFESVLAFFTEMVYNIGNAVQRLTDGGSAPVYSGLRSAGT